MKVRDKYLPNKRRMGFKSLGDRFRKNALSPFLSAADLIPGVLITFALDSLAIASLSRPTYEHSESIFGSASLWSPRAFGKLIRVAQLGGLVIAGAGSASQNVIWVSDDDEIAPNAARMREVSILLGTYTSQLCDRQMGNFRFGTVGIVDNESQQFEDLLAIPDLAAGAVSDACTQLKRSNGVFVSRVQLDLPTSCSKKTRTICSWYGRERRTLSKLLVVVEGVKDKLQVSVGNFGSG